ncbi:NAD(P)/FAD-dependent oxidoreductase [Elioraea thermophila]|uniref:NAD(P)/FAD-dependent oxidoreductase n=1 Tax=Elioraea thermophila TaxID=2185104 RepID=UPI000DF12940|nr:FAD-dependent oxidoreductase [Elioraea thermophila]
MSRRVVVIGAGAVGAACALLLAREGHRVILVEPGPAGGEQAASYGNAGWISPESVVPVATPGLWRKIPALLLDPEGPLTIRPAALPGLMPWLWRFMTANATAPRASRTSRALAALLHDAVDRHQALAAAAGRPELVARSGHLYIWRDRAGFAADGFAWALRRSAGVAWLELSAEELAQREPALSRDWRFGVLVEAGGQVRDPGALVQAYAQAAESLGAEHLCTRATGFRLERGRLRAVETERGLIDADAAVIAAGIRSAALARAAGERIPLASERGYHVMIRDPEVTVRMPVMAAELKAPLTPMQAGLRVAGQVELARIDDPPDWRRAAILERAALKLLPGLPQPLPRERITVWMGHRPSVADGLPVIGASRVSPDIFYAFGHGHVGLAAAPKTAVLIADLIAGRSPTIDPTPYSPLRFR